MITLSTMPELARLMPRASVEPIDPPYCVCLECDPDPDFAQGETDRDGEVVE